MNVCRLALITLSLTLLVACGGGGSSGTAATTPTPENPLAGLANFMPTTDSSLQVVQDIVSPDAARINTSSVFEEGSLDGVATNCNMVGCVVPLPGGVAASPSDVTDIPYLRSIIGDISLISNFPSFFSASTYSSEITNGIRIEGIEGITFARGKLTGTRDQGSSPLEFQTFAGWLNGSIFGTTQIEFEVSGNQQHRFISYNAGIPATGNPTATGSETSATWQGVTVASIKADRTFILGDAEITVNFMDTNDDTNVDLLFDEWRDLDNEELSMSPIRYDGLKFSSDINGTFFTGSDDEQVQGRFYGQGHAEVSGWFNNEDFMGAFGGRRQTGQ